LYLNREILFNLPGASSTRVMCVGRSFIISGHFVLFWHTLDVSSVNMDEGTKGRVSELLSEASRLLSSSSSTALNPAVNFSRSAILQATINETLRRAESMFQENGQCKMQTADWVQNAD